MIQYKLKLFEKINKKPKFSRFIFNCYNIQENNYLCGELKFHYDDNVIDLFDSIIPENKLNKIYLDNKTIYINTITVEDEYKNLGVANYIMTNFIEFFKKQNKYNYISLLVVPFKYGAKEKLSIDLLIKFYQKFGFEIIGYNDTDSPLMILKK